MDELNFYTRPFRKDKFSGWVWDAKGNFVFQFEKPFTNEIEEIEKIMFRLNALDKNTEDIPDYNLTLKNPIEIYNDGKPFIMIRGWGGLTGTGGHGFSVEKATEIQDDFVVWLLERLKN